MLFKSKKSSTDGFFCVNMGLVAVVDLTKKQLIFVDKGWEVSKKS